jgi:hypothetical protein
MFKYFTVLLILIFTSQLKGQIIKMFPEGELEGEFNERIVLPDDPQLAQSQNQENDKGSNRNNSSTGPNGNISTLKKQLNLQTQGFGGTKIASGDWGIENLSLHGGLSLTSFDDSSNGVNSSGHFRDYSLSLSGDITSTDSISLGFSKSRYETGGSQGILSRIQGVNFTWVHNLNENFGIGLLGFLNDVDIEEINGNSYSYGYGLLFTSFHSFKYFDLATATVLAHSDFETGYDQTFLSSLTISRQWGNEFASFVTLNFTDSIKSDPSNDPTYGTWEVGGIYTFSENISVTLAYSKTEFLNNFSDNTVRFNLSWYF